MGALRQSSSTTLGTFLALAIAAVQAKYVSAEECSNGTVGTAVAAADAGDPLEYAGGLPGGTVKIRFNNKSLVVHYAKVGNLAIFDGDVVLGTVDEIDGIAANDQLLTSLAGPMRFRVGNGEPTENRSLSLLASRHFDDTLGFGLQADFTGTLWPKGKVPYMIDPALPASQHASIKEAADAWTFQSLKTVEFSEIKSADGISNYVYFVHASEAVCQTRGLGMTSGREVVELGDSCAFGHILHEMGHVLGLLHEQNRDDRDSYVEIHMENIKKGMEGQFQDTLKDGATLGTTYDFDSIMHYPPRAFSCNSLETITIKPGQILDPGIKMGQRNHLSAGDLATIKVLYRTH